MYIYSFNPLSKGAKRLAQSLSWKRIKHNNSRFTGRGAPWVLNWGATHYPPTLKHEIRILNAPEAVQRVSNKLTFFHDMNGLNITPSSTVFREVAENWIEMGFLAVERHILNGHGGIGIRIVEKIEDLQDAPLYVQYIPKKEEYRVHIFNGKVIDIQKKVRKQGFPVKNWKVRNYENGFIYKREDINPDPMVFNIALRSIAAIYLLFGAVDVIWNEKQQRAYVLEINTAPGLEGQTVDSYTQAIKEDTK